MPSILDLRPLPLARQGVKTPKQWLADYEALPKQPLLVQAKLVTPYVGAIGNKLHFDSILAFAWVASLPHPVAFDEAMVTPLPLEALQVVDGPKKSRLPVWASSYLAPSGQILRDRAYWHKRYPVDRSEFSTKLNTSTVAGRNKEYRVPLQTTHTDTLQAVVIGNQAEVERLLALVSHVGTKRSQGYGRVSKWTAEPLAMTIEAARDLITYQRPMPSPDGPIAGFTPPYWYAPWHSTIANQ